MLIQRSKLTLAAAALKSVPSWNLIPDLSLKVYVRPSSLIVQLSASWPTISLPVPGLSVTRPSKICCSTYDELASSTSAGSVRFRSPGMAMTRVPPPLGVPAVDADGSTDGAVEAPVEAGGATDAGAELVVAPPQAAKTIAVTAKSAPMRTRLIAPPPDCESSATATWATPDGWWMTRTRDRIPWDFHGRTLHALAVARILRPDRVDPSVCRSRLGPRRRSRRPPRPARRAPADPRTPAPQAQARAGSRRSRSPGRRGLPPACRGE